MNTSSSPLSLSDAVNYAALAKDVHIHLLSLQDLNDQQIGIFMGFLSAEERAHVERLRTSALRRQFQVARGALRFLLGRYLSVDPSAVIFAYGPYGKPCVVQPDTPPIRFNLSHSGNLVAYAFTRQHEVGIDIEQHDDRALDTALYSVVFTASEQDALLALPAALRLRGFFSAWTRKEAFIKATGQGLSADLQAFSVTVTPDAPVTLFASSSNMAVAGWHIHTLDLPPGYEGAVAISGDDSSQFRIFYHGC